MFLDALSVAQRPIYEELWRCMETEEAGEYACCGVFLPVFISTLTRADHEMGKKEKNRALKLLKEIGRGAREILKVHSGVSMAARSVELRQTSIKSFMKEAEDADKDPETTEKKKRKKRTPRSKYVNPGRDSDNEEDEDKAPRIKNPPNPEIVFKRYIETTVVGERGGGMSYTENGRRVDLLSTTTSII